MPELILLVWLMPALAAYAPMCVAAATWEQAMQVCGVLAV